ncbi:Predicted arabinose efflux permease, MFS family [Actinomadura madurae]|uniref:Predicted arabinose efflux permease, MFS family n=1 Tax=Actinomadura madurae TaxID=1993 RepID=A0A1I5FFP2_9ACTN|nr:MFS transporter [Actinomadura madurae]SFO22618.1 Predicted arabinose efflux permease, MFS family [Actinomadura madurae]
MSSTTGPARPALMLAVLLTGQFMVNVDIAVVNVAAPSIHHDLRPSGGALELIVSGYTLAYAVLLVTGARLGEVRGHRRMFLLGLGAFTLASLGCGLSPSTGALVAARLAQGAAGALMVPQVLSGIQIHLTGTARARAQGMLAVALSGGAVAGQVLGGVLVTADLSGLGWRPIFLVNVPVGIVLLAAGARLLPADTPGAGRRLDLGGVALLSAATLLAIVPLLFGRETGWPAWTWASLAACPPVLALFARRQRRVASPLLNLGVLARPVVAWTLAALGAATGTFYALLFVLALYLQQGLARSALFSGMVLVPWVAAFGVAGPLVPRLPARAAERAPVAGYLLLAAVYAAIGLTHADGTALAILLGFGGHGLGLGFAPQLGRLTAAVPARHAADLSGLVNMNFQLAGVAGIAVFGTLYLGVPGGHAHAVTVVLLGFGATALAAAAASFAGHRASRRDGQGSRPARRAVVTASRRV